MWGRVHNYYSITIFIGGITSLDELYSEVHILAYYYKWEEDKILSLPIFKRQKYIELIEKQIKAENSSEDDVDYGVD